MRRAAKIIGARAASWLGGAGLALALAMAGLQAKAADASRPDPDAAAMKAVCGRCHNLQLVAARPRSDEQWMATLQKMVDLGANGTDAQFDAVVRYVRAHLTVVNVNAATPEQLEQLLSVPATVAQAIVARRERDRFRDLADLSTVRGVNAASLAQVQDRIAF